MRLILTLALFFGMSGAAFAQNSTQNPLDFPGGNGSCVDSSNTLEYEVYNYTGGMLQTPEQITSRVTLTFDGEVLGQRYYGGTVYIDSMPETKILSSILVDQIGNNFAGTKKYVLDIEITGQDKQLLFSGLVSCVDTYGYFAP